MFSKAQKNLTLIGATVFILIQGAIITFDSPVKALSKGLHLAASIIIAIALLGLVFRKEP